MVHDDNALVLPDSRLKTDKGRVSGWHPYFGRIDWVPVFCANCGKPWGNVPAENIDFACYLCDGCAEHWGTQFGMALMPDEVFWRKVHMEMIEKYGRVLTEAETTAQLQYDCNPLSKLLKEGV